MEMSTNFEIERIELRDCCCCTWKCTTKACNLLGVLCLIAGILLPTCLHKEMSPNHGWALVLTLWLIGIAALFSGLFITECFIKPREQRDRAVREEESTEAGSSQTIRQQMFRRNQRSGTLTARQAADLHRTHLQRLAAQQLLASQNRRDTRSVWPFSRHQSTERIMRINEARLSSLSSSQRLNHTNNHRDRTRQALTRTQRRGNGSLRSHMFVGNNEDEYSRTILRESTPQPLPYNDIHDWPVDVQQDDDIDNCSSSSPRSLLLLSNSGNFEMGSTMRDPSSQSVGDLMGTYLLQQERQAQRRGDFRAQRTRPLSAISEEQTRHRGMDLQDRHDRSQAQPPSYDTAISLGSIRPHQSDDEPIELKPSYSPPPAYESIIERA